MNTLLTALMVVGVICIIAWAIIALAKPGEQAKIVIQAVVGIVVLVVLIKGVIASGILN